eukprot:TRINITY_DN18349_c0_g1_i1.p1 TRINITY_DN18349_c0_g1~~TRINITY_DN18349_c0_g1_i1.p1  ORF type:complete len:188 (-),score=20.73 TRINITY_DN18349_c0_g1_i1:525-1088(-)
MRLMKCCLITLTLISTCQGQSCRPTRSDVLGPKFVRGANRTNILAPRSELNDPLKRTTISGRVLDRSCKPVPGARIDIWYAGGQAADGNAIYTERGQRLWYRGYEIVGEDGKYEFYGTYPGIYRGRPIRHYHIKVDAKNREFITQVYFKGDISPGFENYVERAGNTVNVRRGREGARFVKLDVVIDN